MNRFIRSALLPVLVISILVWLAFKTLDQGPKTEKVTYSEFKTLVNKRDVEEVKITPTKLAINAKKKGEETRVKTNYPSDQSLLSVERLMARNGVKYDSKGAGTSTWVSVLTSLLPFVLLLGFWIFLMNQVQGGG